MPELQIIYTPDADSFRLSDIEMIGWRPPDNPAVQNLRKNYQKLKEKVPNLPLEVGVVTYHEILKQDSRKKLEELRVASTVKSTTTYIPLDILCSALELRNKDLTDPLAEEYVSRTLAYLMGNSSLSLDKSLTKEMKTSILLCPCMPKIERVQAELQKSIGLIRQKTANLNKIFNRIEKEMAKTRELYPTWGDFNVLYEHILERFKANKVSKSFPLYFFSPGNYLPSLYLVSLVDKIETPDYIPEVLKYIKEGCKAMGLKEIPEDVKKRVMVGQKDRFGETKRMNTSDIGELINLMPEPKKLITDLYIVDQFPQLVEIGFDSYEFKLD